MPVPGAGCARGGDRVPVLVLRGGDTVPVLGAECRCWCCELAVHVVETGCRCWCWVLALRVVETGCRCRVPVLGAGCVPGGEEFVRQIVTAMGFVLFPTTMSWLCALSRQGRCRVLVLAVVLVLGAVSWLCAWWRHGAGAGAGCWQCACGDSGRRCRWCELAVRVVKAAARVVETGCRVLGAGAGLGAGARF